MIQGIVKLPAKLNFFRIPRSRFHRPGPMRMLYPEVLPLSTCAHTGVIRRHKKQKKELKSFFMG
jgi:hypothetical protein